YHLMSFPLDHSTVHLIFSSVWKGNEADLLSFLKSLLKFILNNLERVSADAGLRVLILHLSGDLTFFQKHGPIDLRTTLFSLLSDFFSGEEHLPLGTGAFKRRKEVRYLTVLKTEYHRRSDLIRKYENISRSPSFPHPLSLGVQGSPPLLRRL